MEWDSERFRSARVKAGMSQGQIAKHLGVSLGGVRHWERGDYGPRALILVKVVEDFMVGVESGEIEPQGKRWSREHDKCVACGTTDQRHWGKGRCWKCRQSEMRKEAREAHSQEIATSEETAVAVA